MSDTYDVEGANVGLESIGPFQIHKLRLDGYRIPHLNGRLIDGVWHFILDERFGCEIPEKYGTSVAWMIANALAIGAGYSCFGENSQIANPFTVKMHGLSLTPEIEMSEASEITS